MGDQRRLRRACAQSHQSLRCSPTWRMEVDEVRHLAPLDGCACVFEEFTEDEKYHGSDNGNRSFRTQVISYPGHFVPKSVRTILVISYPLLFSIWSFRTQFGHFVPISHPVWSFRTYFYYFLEKRFGHFVHVPIFCCLVPKSLRTRSNFVPILVISYPGHFVSTSKLGMNWPGYEMTFFFAVICYFQTRYELTLVWNDFLVFL